MTWGMDTAKSCTRCGRRGRLLSPYWDRAQAFCVDACVKELARFNDEDDSWPASEPPEPWPTDAENRLLSDEPEMAVHVMRKVRTPGKPEQVPTRGGGPVAYIGCYGVVSSPVTFSNGRYEYHGGTYVWT